MESLSSYVLEKKKKHNFFFTSPIVKISHSFPDYTCNDDGKNKWHFQFNH